MNGKSTPEPLWPTVGPTPAECDRRLREHGLEVPTTAQWQRACAVDAPVSNGIDSPEPGPIDRGAPNRYGIADVGLPELCRGSGGLVQCSPNGSNAPQLVEPNAPGRVAIRAARAWRDK